MSFRGPMQQSSFMNVHSQAAAPKLNINTMSNPKQPEGTPSVDVSNVPTPAASARLEKQGSQAKLTFANLMGLQFGKKKRQEELENKEKNQITQNEFEVICHDVVQRINDNAIDEKKQLAKMIQMVN